MAWNGTEKDQNLGMHEMEQKGNAEVIKQMQQIFLNIVSQAVTRHESCIVNKK